MRAFGRDLIRGGHYGQRSCEPHLKAEHMAAPTNAAYVKKALANSEPSTHGTQRRCRHSSLCPVLKVERPPSRCRFTLTELITDVTRGRQGRNSNLLETGSRLWTNELVDCYRAGNEALVRRGYGTCFVFQISRWWSSCGRLTDLLRSKVNCWALRRLSPTSRQSYQGMVDFHWSAANLPEAKNSQTR